MKILFEWQVFKSLAPFNLSNIFWKRITKFTEIIEKQKWYLIYCLSPIVKMLFESFVPWDVSITFWKNITKFAEIIENKMIVNVVLVNNYDYVIQVTGLKSLVPWDLSVIEWKRITKFAEIIENKNDHFYNACQQSLRSNYSDKSYGQITLGGVLSSVIKTHEHRRFSVENANNRKNG